MRRLFFLALIVIAAAGAYWLYNDKDANKRMRGWMDQALNYPAAETPEQAADFFIKAIKERDYKKASAYCTPEYGKYLAEVASSAKTLGDSIDGLMYKMTEFKTTNATECRIALWMLDPFPKEGLSIVVAKDNDPNTLKATAQFKLVPVGLNGDRPIENMPQGYRVNDDYVQSLYKGIPLVVKMKRVKDKDGDKYRWFFDFDVPPGLPQSVKTLNNPDRGGKLASQIKDLSMSINKEAAVKEDFVKSFKEQVIEWAKN